MRENRLVAILGPTASGKSALAIWIAERLAGEVLVCDSTQVYRGFNIGTAKVPASQRRGVPHHLVDLIEPDEIFTAGDYRRRALEVLEDICRRGKLAILTVGTGLYLRALLEGLADAPARSEHLRERLRREAAAHEPGYLHRVLCHLDHEAAERIAPRDTQKLIRAIEVCVLAGKPLTAIHQSGREALTGFQVVKLGLLPPRAELYERIERRVYAMLDAGWVQELKGLLGRGVTASSKPISFIGYKQLREYIEGHAEKETAIRDIQQATRRYAKRQITWFRKEAGARWFRGFGDDPKVAQAALDHLQSWLRP